MDPFHDDSKAVDKVDPRRPLMVLYTYPCPSLTTPGHPIRVRLLVRSHGRNKTLRMDVNPSTMLSSMEAFVASSRRRARHASRFALLQALRDLQRSELETYALVKGVRKDAERLSSRLAQIETAMASVGAHMADIDAGLQNVHAGLQDVHAGLQDVIQILQEPQTSRGPPKPVRRISIFVLPRPFRPRDHSSRDPSQPPSATSLQLSARGSQYTADLVEEHRQRHKGALSNVVATAGRALRRVKSILRFPRSEGARNCIEIA
ncbi:hypothetical protein OH77DRAFT_283127 [Trametes cingulata]|nr:hypothetical protein OH77DRAFT_283127 [Trametes cingulata]